jgi:hypothetical protein
MTVDGTLSCSSHGVDSVERRQCILAAAPDSTDAALCCFPHRCRALAQKVGATLLVADAYSLKLDEMVKEDGGEDCPSSGGPADPFDLSGVLCCGDLWRDAM